MLNTASSTFGKHQQSERKSTKKRRRGAGDQWVVNQLALNTPLLQGEMEAPFTAVINS